MNTNNGLNSYCCQKRESCPFYSLSEDIPWQLNDEPKPHGNLIRGFRCGGWLFQVLAEHMLVLHDFRSLTSQSVLFTLSVGSPRTALSCMVSFMAPPVEKHILYKERVCALQVWCYDLGREDLSGWVRQNSALGDLPSGPVAKTLRYQCRGPRFHSWSGN